MAMILLFTASLHRGLTSHPAEALISEAVCYEVWLCCLRLLDDISTSSYLPRIPGKMTRKTGAEKRRQMCII